MNNRMEKKMRIPVSLCDCTGHLDVPGFFTIFMDMASEHATDIGVGMDNLGEKGLIWLAVKSKFKFYDFPQMFSTVTAATWPTVSGRIRGDRLYTMKTGDRLIAEGKNEWAIFNPETGRFGKFSDVYPENFVHWPEIVCDESYAKLKYDFDDATEISRHRVTGSDLDTSRHMNNVEYLKVMFGALSSTQLAQMDIACVEIAYKHQCYEGEELSVRIKEADGGFEMGLIKEDGTAGAVALIILR